ncbi:MAG TPA: CHAT domain-containing protein [Pyrinomonadaceae bacterium]|jgi:hypothetical protein
MRTITLELLRHGPAHNQLLSPLTPYLALCENHPAVTLNVPFEHNQFLHQLRALSYKIKDESRTFQLNDTARILGELLAEIPGLLAESNKESCGEEQLVHLRLILSASELALLPFELALSPNGLPGSGQHLLLQPQLPICLTREIRRVHNNQVKWQEKPKILFIAAAPPEVGEIPLDSHLLVLRRLISPWVNFFDENNPDERRVEIEKHLHFLPNASIEAIEKACASDHYTHIHILAHGVEVKDNYDTRFCIALHNSLNPNKTENISGPRLAAALRASTRPENQSMSTPAVVTLASCDSGNVGSVAGAGASIAHALHEAGIPIVVAGQFPLSFGGSVRLVECLYEGLLWGNDPRRLLYDLRRRLYTQFQENHDWASLTAYVSLPSDFEKHLNKIKIKQVSESINAAMNYADKVTGKLSNEIKKRDADSAQPGGQAGEGNNQEKKKLIENAIQKIEDAKKRLKRLCECISEHHSEITGNLASTEKRHAEVLFRASNENMDVFDEEARKRYKKEYLNLLENARIYYWKSFLQKRSDSWAVVQYLSLTLTLERLKGKKNDDLNPISGTTDRENNERYQKTPDNLWSLAHLLSLYDVNSKNEQARIWAYGNLIELYMLSSAIFDKAEKTPDVQKILNEAQDQAIKYTNTLVDIAEPDSFEIYSTRRQILRYIEWFGKISDLGDIPEVAKKIFKILPDNGEYSDEIIKNSATSEP